MPHLPNAVTPEIGRHRDRPRAHRLAAPLLTALIVAASVGCSSGDDEATEAPDSTSDPASTAPVVDSDLVLATDGDVVAVLDDRYQSYNIEMVEVTGGNFWAPYDAEEGRIARPPIDLSSPRLRNLAEALGPAYIRVSGLWANSTYFDIDGTTGGTPPGEFGGVLTTDQWLGVGEFADAVDGQIVTSFATGDDVRDDTGAWLPDQARALLRFSVEHDIPVVAAELFNEPNLPVGIPAGFDVDVFASDLEAFLKLVDEEMPDLTVLGPGTAAEESPLVVTPTFTSDDVLDRVGPIFDVLSYHFYPKVSERCASQEGPEIALTEEYLSRVEVEAAHFRDVRDRHLPGVPMWVTETAQAACGGDRWAATYRDAIRFVDTLGRLADGDGDVVFHNTLAASDYALIDEDGFVPRPNYWAAVLWARLMGPRVLDVADGNGIDDLSVYAHCAPDGAETPGITYAVVNSSATEIRTVSTRSGEATVYQLGSDDLDAHTVQLNGAVLQEAEDGTLPDMPGQEASGAIELPPASVTFVVDTGSTDCS